MTKDSRLTPEQQIKYAARITGFNKASLKRIFGELELEAYAAAINRGELSRAQVQAAYWDMNDAICKIRAELHASMVTERQRRSA